MRPAVLGLLFVLVLLLVQSGRALQWQWRQRPSLRLGDRRADIESLRASEIKALLASKSVSTRGLFEKADLVSKLLEVESSQEQPSSRDVYEVPLIDVPFSPSGGVASSFVGIKLTIGGKPRVFVLDTAASFSLIKADVLSDMITGTFVVSDASSQKTIGMGGMNSITSRVCKLDEAVIEPSKNVVLRGLEFAVLDNAKTLPNNCDGLLGLTFFSSFSNGLSELDFTGNVLRVGMDCLPWPKESAGAWGAVSLQKSYTGPRLCQLVVPTASSSTTPVMALVDLGSTRTIFNSHAVTAISDGKLRLNDLPPTGEQVVGIDGRPVTLRRLTLAQGMRLGTRRVQSSLDVWAADLPGFSDLGLSHIPAALLGMDVLAGVSPGRQRRAGKFALDLKQDWLYLQG